MAIENKTVYVNGYFFLHLAGEHHFGDRPEFNRQHEYSLWTVYQILKAGGNTATITDAEKQIEKEITNEAEFKAWVEETYPGFANQLDKKVYTSHPHPMDKIG